MPPLPRLRLIPLLLLLPGLALWLSACQGQGLRAALARATPTSTITPTPTVTPTLTPTATPTPVPPLFQPAIEPPAPNQATRMPAAGACSHRIRFLKDVTIPDGITLQPGAAFVKTWRLKNAGRCAWSPDYRLVFVGGERMGGPEAQPLGKQVQPGAQVDVSVKLTAPQTSGAYASQWMLETPEGERFGLGEDGQTPFWLKIVIP